MKFKGHILLFLVAAVPFLRALDFGLINLDDYSYVLGHPELVHWSGIKSLLFALTSSVDSIWMPLTRLSYALDWVLFGDWFGGFHLHSILVHGLNAILVWRLLLLIFKAEDRMTRLACFAGAVLWAIHPLRCESVVAISSRKDVLSLFWGLLSFILWLKGGRTRTALALVCFALGAFCKPSVMTLPVLFLLMDVCLKREVRPLRYVAPVLMTVGLMFFAVWQQKSGGAMADYAAEPMWGRLLGACAAFGIYIRNFVCPLWLAPQCVNVWPQMPRFLWPGVAISVLWGMFLVPRGLDLVQGVMRELRDAKRGGVPERIVIGENVGYLFFGMAWFAIAVFPMLGFANFGYHAFADRFTYIPAIGLSVCAVQGVLCLVRGVGIWDWGLGIGCVALLSVLGALTWRQTGFWENDRTAFSHTLEVDGDRNYQAHNILAGWYFEHPHDLESCIREYETAMKYDIYPSLPCYAIYVLALCESGQVDRVRDKLHEYENAIVRRYGYERAQQLLSFGRGEARTDLIGYVYHWSRVAMWVFSPDCRDLAEDAFADTRDESNNIQAIWLYMKMRFAERKGDRTAARQLREEILSIPPSANPIRFGFLRNEKE